MAPLRSCLVGARYATFAGDLVFRLFAATTILASPFLLVTLLADAPLLPLAFTATFSFYDAFSFEGEALLPALALTGLARASAPRATLLFDLAFAFAFAGIFPKTF